MERHTDLYHITDRRFQKEPRFGRVKIHRKIAPWFSVTDLKRLAERTFPSLSICHTAGQVGDPFRPIIARICFHRQRGKVFRNLRHGIVEIHSCIFRGIDQRL